VGQRRNDGKTDEERDGRAGNRCRPGGIAARRTATTGDVTAEVKSGTLVIVGDALPHNVTIDGIVFRADSCV